MFLADTDLISEPRLISPHPRVMEWLQAHDDELFLSAISIGEIRKGIELYPDSRKKAELSEWFDGLLDDFEDCILGYSLEEAMIWGMLYVKAQKAGRKPPGFDSLNAAIALRNDLTLVTRNENDYAGMNIKILNPWK